MKRFVGFVLMMAFAVHVALATHDAMAAIAPATQETADPLTMDPAGAAAQCYKDAGKTGHANSGPCVSDCPYSLGQVICDLPVVRQQHAVTEVVSPSMRYTGAVFRPPIGR